MGFTVKFRRPARKDVADSRKLAVSRAQRSRHVSKKTSSSSSSASTCTRFRLAAALLGGIVILMMIQLTAYAHESMDANNLLGDSAKNGPPMEALQNQRKELLEQRQRQRLLEQEQENDAQREREEREREQREREQIDINQNIVDQEVALHVGEIQQKVILQDLEKLKRLRGIKRRHTRNKLVVEQQDQQPDEGQEGQEIVDETSNQVNVLERGEIPEKTRRPFQLQRSDPNPPSSFRNRSMPVDVIGDYTFDLSKLKPLNYTLRSQWHGVLLDAGRHYFDVRWLYRMLDVLAVLQFNCLHFRLTDDQAWNVRLESQPGLAHPVGIMGRDNVYTPDELRSIVAYAKTKGITIWPEINVPGHGGGWAGIPGLIVQCPEFICDKGYGVPINVEHPKFKGVLKDVLQEIIQIFDNPPYLHLGGDEVDMAQPCFDEVGQPMFNYDVFEQELKTILDDINYPESQVIRWEMTGQRLDSPRTGKMPQHWFRIPGDGGPNLGRNNFFGSAGLYFDYNEMDMAWKVFLFTRRYYHLPNENFPIGIIVGTFELDSNFWFDRNVVGRLLAVTMGASMEVEADDGNELYGIYRETCRGVGFDDNLCNHFGLPLISWKKYKEKWGDVWTLWKQRICDRLTTATQELKFIKPSDEPNRRAYMNFYRQSGTNTKERFWDVYGVRENPVIDIESSKFEAIQHNNKLSRLMNRLVPNAGIVMDLTILRLSEVELRDVPLLRHMHSVALNLIQLRLSTDHHFAYRSNHVPQASISPQQSLPSFDAIKDSLIADASRMSIGIIPEISLSTYAAGLYEVDQNVECPKYMCETGHGAQDITDTDFLSRSYLLVREIESIATSGMIHLGSDERLSGEKCYAEANREKPDYDSVEKKLGHLLAFDDIHADRIIRWSNEEGIEYPGRLGTITQCRTGDCRKDGTSQWVATVDLEKGGAFDIFKAARDLALQKPSSIFGEVGKIDNGSLDANNIPKRILAFTMGISDISLNSRDGFEEAFNDMCSSLFGIDANCSDFVKSDLGVEGTSNREEEHRSSLCSERTTTVTRKVYRPEFQEQEAAVSVEMKV